MGVTGLRILSTENPSFAAPAVSTDILDQVVHPALEMEKLIQTLQLLSDIIGGRTQRRLGFETTRTNGELFETRGHTLIAVGHYP